MSSTPTSIRYVVLSDLHLGQDRSVLTAVDKKEEPTPELTEPALQALMECLQYLVKQNAHGAPRPTVILLGDIMEQAFTDIDVSGPIFQRFVDLWKGDDREPIFDKVVFVPGNHDHNMWEFTRSHHYWQSLVEWTDKAAGNPKTPLPPRPSLGHTTPLREPLKGDQDLIGLLINRQLAPSPPLPVEVYYPTFAIGSESKERALLFNHGHFFEDAYQLMSNLQSFLYPEHTSEPTADSLERSNFAWLEFLWTALGRQGDVGHTAERLWDIAGKPALIKAEIRNLVYRGIQKLSWINPDGLASKCISVIIASAASELARLLILEPQSSEQRPLRPAALENMRRYVTGPLRKQLDMDNDLSKATDLTLVFGHTHKPFQSKDAIYPIKVYNTGGWVIDPLLDDSQPLRGGSCLLLNEQLDIASIQFYRQHVDENKYQVEAESLDEETTFYKSIARAIKDDDRGVFRNFSSKVAKSVSDRLRQMPGR